MTSVFLLHKSFLIRKQSVPPTCLVQEYEVTWSRLRRSQSWTFYGSWWA